MSHIANLDPRYAVVEDSLDQIKVPTGAQIRPVQPLNAPPAYVDCGTCLEYLQRRHRVLIPHIVRIALRDGVRTQRVVHRLLTGAHVRHEKGLPL